MATTSRVTPWGWEQGDDSADSSRVTPGGWEQVVGAGGGSVSGTSATTNANDTPSANGTTTVVGTSATTNAADTSAASGTVGGGASGTSATTNAADTSTASGTTTVTGTVAYSNANDAVLASGWAGLISGTVAVTNADDTSAAVGSAGPVQAARLFAGGFPRREQFRKGYIIKGKRYWLTEEELAVMVAQMLAEISRGDIKQVTAGKPKTISKKTWDAIQVEARIEAVAKQFDDTDEDEDESILMML